MQWLKADDFKSCIIDDSARNSHSCFVRTGHIVIAHDAGIDLYGNQGFKIKLVSSHVSDLGYVAIETDPTRVRADDGHLVGDSRRLTQALSWTPQVGLRDGLARLVRSHLAVAR